MIITCTVCAYTPVLIYVYYKYQSHIDIDIALQIATIELLHQCIYLLLCTYGTAQRTRTCAASGILSSEDYITRSIFERVPITFMPASGKLSGVCTSEHYIILYELLNEYYNISSILYTMNLRILSLYVLINP